MSSKTKFFKAFLKGIEEVQKTEDISIRKTTIAFEEVPPGIEKRIKNLIIVDHHDVEVPADKTLLELIQPNYNTIKAVSEDSGIPESTLREWCRKGKIEAVQDARRLWWIRGTVVGKKVKGKWNYHQIYS